jgi:hypothetical protein
MIEAREINHLYLHVVIVHWDENASVVGSKCRQQKTKHKEGLGASLLKPGR